MRARIFAAVAAFSLWGVSLWAAPVESAAAGDGGRGSTTTLQAQTPRSGSVFEGGNDGRNMTWSIKVTFESDDKAVYDLKGPGKIRASSRLERTSHADTSEWTIAYKGKLIGDDLLPYDIEVLIATKPHSPCLRSADRVKRYPSAVIVKSDALPKNVLVGRSVFGCGKFR